LTADKRRCRFPIKLNLLEIVEIRDKLRAELAVVEKFLEIAKARGANGSSNGSIPDKATPQEQPNPNQRNLQLPGNEGGYGSISETVREAIRIAPEKYSIRNLFEILGRINKPLTKLQIGTPLSRFEIRGEIEVHRKGKGNKPTVFKKSLETAQI